MGWKDDFLVQPGTVMMIIFIAAFGMTMFSWTSNYFKDQGQQAEEDQGNLLDCSNLEISVIDIERFNSSTKAFFESNKKVEKIYVNFEGESNVTKSVSSVAPGSIQTATADLSNLTRLYFNAKGCSKTFEK